MSKIEDNVNNSGTEPAAENTESSPQKKRRITAAVSAVILAGCLAAGFFLVSAVFTGPEEIPQVPLQNQDFFLQQKLIRKISREVFRRKPKKESVIMLAPGEIESLLRMIDFGASAAKLAGKYDGLEPRYFRIAFALGQMQGEYPFDTGMRWLCGGVMPLRFTVIPAWENGTLTVEIREFRIGSLPVPRQIAEKFLADWLREFHGSKVCGRFEKAVKKVQLKQDGSMEVVYSPAALLPLLMYGIR